MSESIRIQPFYGYPHSESVINFLDNIRLYLATKPDWDAVQKLTIVESALRGPALSQYRAATINNGDDDNAHLENVYTWLKDTFFTAADRQSIRNQLFATYQYTNESPASFFSRLCHLMQHSGLEEPVVNANLMQAFQNGLHREVKEHVMTFALPTL